MAAIGGVVGFYDGFFGPGAGSFYVFAFVRLLGTRLALKHGARFVRIAFIVVVSALILKTGWDAFRR